LIEHVAEFARKEEIKQAMRTTRLSLFSKALPATWVVLAFAGSQALALPGAPPAKNPPAPAGVSIEIEHTKMPASAKFTNDTDRELAFIYGPEKFSLKPGASKSVPVPKPETFELRIFESLGKGRLQERFQSQATPDDPKRVIPLIFEKPKKAR
jgi:hypothetical protein